MAGSTAEWLSWLLVILGSLLLILFACVVYLLYRVYTMHRALSERPQPKPGAGYFVDATGAAFCPRCQGEGKDSTPMLEIGDKLHCYACGCSCLKAKD